MFNVAFVLVLIARSATVNSQSASGVDWSYEGDNGPDNWSKTYATCGSSEQSPIDLTSTCTFQSFGNFSGGLIGTVPSIVNMTLLNAGHTVSLTPANIVTVSGGGLSDTYNVAAIHFHWGNSSDRGSEHTVGGKRYPMELHVVTYKINYVNLQAALRSSDREAVAVLGIFVQVKSANSTSPAVDVIANALENVSKPGNSTMVSLPMTDLATVFQSIVLNSPFYRYLGSLTTPTCDQKVKWTVFQDALGITEKQLNAFRMLTAASGQPMVNNYRPTQSVNSRTVYCSSPSMSQPVVGSGWSYEGENGPDNWSKTYATCGSSEQSPIDLTSTCTFQSFGNFSGGLIGAVPSVVDMTLLNAGHTVSLTPASIVTVSGGGLSDTYNVAAVHFHWGNSSDRGSEHTVGGKRYPMELHIVTYKMNYVNLQAALRSSDREAVAVLGIFVQVNSVSSTSPAVDVIANALANVSKPGSSTVVSLPMTDLVTVFQFIVLNSPFYRYLGSLTTPTCDQRVKWTVFKDTLGITEKQLNAFRMLTAASGQPMVDNYRPTQSVNSRTVYCSSLSMSQPLKGGAAVSGGGFDVICVAAMTAAALLLRPPSRRS